MKLFAIVGIGAGRDLPKSGIARRRPQIEGLEDRLLFSRAIAPSDVLNLTKTAAPQASTLPKASATKVNNKKSSTTASTTQTLVQLTVQPLDLKLLGLEVKSTPIAVTISSTSGNGMLLGNALNSMSGTANLSSMSTLLNSVLGRAVDVVNGGALSVSGVDTTGPLGTASVAVGAPVLKLTVPAVQANVLGARVEISPIQLSIIPHTGPGLVLGNALAKMSNLFNPPLPSSLSLDTLNAQLQQIVAQLNSAAPGIAPAPTAAPNLGAGDTQVLSTALPGINLNLLGFVLQTDPVSLDAAAASGSGKLLGNVYTTLSNTLGQTPAGLATVYSNVNAIFAKIVGALNASSLTVSASAVNTLAQKVQALGLGNLLLPPAAASSSGILDLTAGSTPVGIDLLGLKTTGTNLDAKLSARTGDGQVLGNLLFNLAHTTSGPGSLLLLLGQLGGTPQASTSDLVSMTLPPLDLNLLGLEVQTSPINVKLSAQGGDGELVGNLLTALSSLLNLQTENTAMNNVLGAAANLINSVDLGAAGVNGAGPLATAAPSDISVMTLTVPAVQMNALGALLDVSPVTLTVSGHAGDGLILGNALATLANLFNPPLPGSLDADSINTALTQLLAQLNAHAPGIAPAANAPAPAATTGVSQLLSLGVPSINLNLLGLLLHTDPVRLNATATTVNGALVGNVLTTLQNTLGATPGKLALLSSNVSAVLAKVMGILNASSMTLPASAIASLPPELQTLAQPNLIPHAAGASATIFDLAGGSLPVGMDVLGLGASSSRFDIKLSATPGDGQVLGNLLFNLANLLNPTG